jgi:hypothetical protein
VIFIAACDGVCGSYEPARTCQCDPDCFRFGDCCTDYTGECVPQGGCVDVLDQNGAGLSVLNEDGADWDYEQIAGVDGNALRISTDAGLLSTIIVDFDPTAGSISAGTFTHFELAVRADNDSPTGWQGNWPRVIFEDLDGNFADFTPTAPLLPTDGVEWVLVTVPLAGGPGFTKVGNVNFTEIRSIGFEQDTWDFGFVIDYDAMRFRNAADFGCVATCPAACPDGPCAGDTFTCLP